MKTNPQRVLNVLLAVLIFLPGAYLLFNGLWILEPLPFLLGLANLAMYAFVVWLGRRANVRSVSYFSNEGLARNDGRTLPWTNLIRVVTQIHNGRIWRIEIHFTGGDSAWLIPRRVLNFADVHGFVRSLPCEHTDVEV